MYHDPYWADSASSRVRGQVTGRADAPNKENDVPWLKLEAVERFGSPDLSLQGATFIQRVLTYGGQAPSATGPSDGTPLACLIPLFIPSGDRVLTSPGVGARPPATATVGGMHNVPLSVK